MKAFKHSNLDILSFVAGVDPKLTNKFCRYLTKALPRDWIIRRHWVKHIFDRLDTSVKSSTNFKEVKEINATDDTSVIRLVPAQYGYFFYMRSHLSALQNCALILSTNF